MTAPRFSREYRAALRTHGLTPKPAPRPDDLPLAERIWCAIIVAIVVAAAVWSVVGVK